MALIKSCILSLTIFLVSSQQDFVSNIPDLCYAPPSPGPCKAYFPKFYYNPLTRSCDCFVFGGCGGNDNNFKNLDECAGNCSAVITPYVSAHCALIFAGSTDAPFAVSPPPGAGVTLPPIDDDAPNVVIGSTDDPFVVSPPAGAGVTLPPIDEDAPDVVIRIGPSKVYPKVPASPDAKRNVSTPLYPPPPTYVHVHPPYGLHHHYYNPYNLPTLHSNFIYKPPRSPYFLPYWLPYHQPIYQG